MNQIPTSRTLPANLSGSSVSLASETARQETGDYGCGNSILVIAYYLIQRHEPYRQLKANYFDQQRPEATTKRLVKRLEQLGLQVSLPPHTSTPVA